MEFKTVHCKLLSVGPSSRFKGNEEFADANVRTDDGVDLCLMAFGKVIGAFKDFTTSEDAADFLTVHYVDAEKMDGTDGFDSIILGAWTDDVKRSQESIDDIEQKFVEESMLSLISAMEEAPLVGEKMPQERVTNAIKSLY